MFIMMLLVGKTLSSSSGSSKSSSSSRCVSNRYRNNSVLDILVFVLLIVQVIGYQQFKNELSSNDMIRQFQKQEDTVPTTTTVPVPVPVPVITTTNESSTEPSYICDFINDSSTIVSNSMDLLSIRHVVSEIDQQIRFEIIYNGIGYIGFALSNTSTMISNIAIIGLPDNNTVLKYSLNGKTVNDVIPLSTEDEDEEEEQTTLRNVSIIQSIQNQQTILQFTRPLQIENNEIDFDSTGQNTINQFIWSVGITNNLGTHKMSGHHIIELIYFCNGTIIPSLVPSNVSSTTPPTPPILVPSQPVPVLVPSPVTTPITTPTTTKPSIVVVQPVKPIPTKPIPGPVPIPIPIPIPVLVPAPVLKPSPTAATVPIVPKVPTVPSVPVKVPVKVPVVSPSPIVVVPTTIQTPVKDVPVVVIPSIPTTPTIPTVVVTTVNGTKSPAVTTNTTYPPTNQPTTTNVTSPTITNITTITTLAPSESIDTDEIVTISVPTQTPSANLLIAPVANLTNTTIDSIIAIDTTKEVTINLPDNLQVTMVPSIDTRYVSVVMTHLHNDIDKSGYIALAVSDTGTMIGSTAIVGSTDNEFPMKYDLLDKSISKVTKVQDDRQTLVNASYIRNSTHTILRFYKLVIENDDETSITLTDGNTTFIYAIGVQSQLAYHGASRRGVFTCSLSSAACTIVDIRLDTVSRSKRSARLAHSILMILAWVILIPSAVGIKVFRQLLLRYPGGQRLWDKIHLNLIYVGTVLTIISFFIAVGATQEENKTHFNRNSHTKVGIVLFIFIILKVLYILYSVSKKSATTTESESSSSSSAAGAGAAVPTVSPTKSLQSKDNDDIEPGKTIDTEDDGNEEEKKEDDDEDVISIIIIPKASTERSEKNDTISDDEDVYVHDDIEDPPVIHDNKLATEQQEVVNDVTPAMQEEKVVVFQKIIPSEGPLSHQQPQEDHQKVGIGKDTNDDNNDENRNENQKVTSIYEKEDDDNDNYDTISDNDSTTTVTTTIAAAKSTNSILSTREVLYRIQWFVLIGISWYACHTGSILFNEQYTNGSINYTAALWSIIGSIMTIFLFLFWYIN